MTRRLIFVSTLALFLPLLSFAESEAGPDSVVGGKYRARYQLQTASQKLIDNLGDGFDDLYGVRNFRAVLNGVYYRGGANNYFNKHKKRANANPLPAEGLRHLCREGFTEAVYLYDKNFDKAAKSTLCRTLDGHSNTLTYKQISPLAYLPEDLAELHGMIFDHVRHPRKGGIYVHCWNGWHASGYVAATTLRQFCDYSAADAVAYWDTNTDGNNVEPGYEKIREAIRNFTPNRNITLSPEEKAVLCPKPGDLVFSPR